MTMKIPTAGRVIWVTRKGCIGRRQAGVGVQLSDHDRGQTQRRIESYLAGALGGEKPTHRSERDRNAAAVYAPPDRGASYTRSAPTRCKY